jgi:hypothetical protein
MRPTSTPPSGALLAANVCGVSTLALLDPTALFDRSLPACACLVRAPRGFSSVHALGLRVMSDSNGACFFSF